VTDARYPERWLNDRRLLTLSDAAHRLFVMALVWSVANRTDGVIADQDFALILRVDPTRAAELGEAGLWRREAGRWLIEDFPGTQTSKDDLEVLANARRRDRERKARQRAGQAAPQVTAAVPGDIPGDRPTDVRGTVPRDKSGDSTRTGQDRTGTGTGTTTELQEGKERGRAPARPRATRIPDDFAVTAEMAAWAREKVPAVDITEETENFRDWWSAKAGAGGVKVDWAATWRTWMRNQAQRSGNGNNATGSRFGAFRRPTTDDKVAAIQAMKSGPPRPALPPGRPPGGDARAYP
jgi:hypothetical protein